MKTFLEKKYKYIIDFTKNGKNYFSPKNIQKYSLKWYALKGKSNFTLKDLRDISKLGIAIQVNGNDFIEPK